MHGRVKVKTTAEQQAEKEKERAKKLQSYRAGQQKALDKRNNGEFDAEAFEVTSLLLQANPDLYTMWNFRREILVVFKDQKEETEMDKVMEGELEFTEACLRTNPKSYGSWHHRVWVLDHMSKPNWMRELALCSKYLELDERNFLCWDYRRLVAERANVSPEKELEFTDKKIAVNFSNYSSWHYRSKLLPLVYPDDEHFRPVCEEKLLKEFELVQNAVFTDPNDQSSWFYHRWLLGRAEQAVKLNFVYADRSGLVIIVFNNPQTLLEVTERIAITCSSRVHDVKWSTPRRAGEVSHVLIGTVENEGLFSAEEQVAVEVSYSGGDNVASLNVSLDDGRFEGWTAKPGWNEDFSMQLSAATVSVLSQEIESCVQLLELEPECKWPVLTCILLMRSLDFTKYYDKILDYFELLASIDPSRRGFYHDLRSKYVFQNRIENLDLSATHLSLSGQSLSSVYHTEFLVHLKVLDLSRNRLTVLSGIEYVRSLEKLVVDDNELKTCVGLQCLPRLETFSARNNRLTLASLEVLCGSRALVSIHLQGNPVETFEKNYKKLVKQLLPNVELID